MACVLIAENINIPYLFTVSLCVLYRILYTMAEGKGSSQLARIVIPDIKAQVGIAMDTVAKTPIVA